MTAWLRRLADPKRPGSRADRYRQRRFAALRRMLEALPRPVRILDVGGTTSFWERLGYAGRGEFQIVLANLTAQDPPYDNMTARIADASDLSEFEDRSFDVVISNSVMEHLPTPDLQRRMAEAVRRVGARAYVQTPNRYFPLEPHFLFPFFALLPVGLRAWLLQRFDLGWHRRRPDRQAALADVSSIRLLTGGELAAHFPGATIERERAFGLTKSFIVLDGWQSDDGDRAYATTDGGPG